MHKEEFRDFRLKLGKTQKQLAQLLGVSVKAIHSYEQGWRSIPAAAERQMFFLLTHKKENKPHLRNCWVVKKCPSKRKNACPAWDFQAGKMCWFVNGTMCGGEVQRDWKEKMSICRACEVLMPMLQ